MLRSGVSNLEPKCFLVWSWQWYCLLFGSGLESFLGHDFPPPTYGFGNQVSSLVDGPSNLIDCGSCFHKLDVNLKCHGVCFSTC